MRQLIPWIAYIACVVISRKFADAYWVVGAVFAITCLVVSHRGITKKMFSLKSGFFILISTLIYALVFWIAKHGWQFKQDFLDMLFGSLTVGVILGSILMPLFHGILYALNERMIRKVFFPLVASWYAVNLMAFLDDVLNLPGNVDYLLI